MIRSIKKAAIIISILMVLSMQTVFAEASDTDTTLTLYLNQTSMKVLKAGELTEITLDSPASAPRGTTMVPVRAVLEVFDAVLTYDPETSQVHISKGSAAITLTINSKTAVVNGKQVSLLEPAVLENNRTLVPLRFISESFGYSVGWDDATKKITISNSGVSTDNTASVTTQPEEVKPDIYYAVKKGIEGLKTEIDVSKYINKNTTSDEVFSIYSDVIDENPGLFYCGSKVEYSSNGIIYPTYSVPAGQVPTMQAAFNSKVDEIIGSIIKPRMSEYERELAIHDYIINNARYDSQNISDGIGTWYDHSAYGVIMYGKGVCDSYAKAMSLLAKKAGLECRLVTGEVNSSNIKGPHAWNMIRISGKYYHVDVTFDDPVTQNADIRTYNYFNLTDKEILKDHTIDDSSKYPKCDSDEYNYFVVNDLRVGSYDEFYDKIEAAVKGGKTEISLEISNFDAKVYDVHSTMERIWKNNSYRSLKYLYSVDDNKGIISISDINISR